MDNYTYQHFEMDAIERRKKARQQEEVRKNKRNRNK